MNLTSYIAYWDNTIKGLLADPPQNSNPLSCHIGIQSDFIPEPFMGDPDRCSFVIVNLNPGTGQCHSCIKQKNVAGTLINKVATYGYSKAVKDFPYLQDGKNVGLKDWDNSGGRKWWKAKDRWIKHILNVCDPTYNPSSPIPNNFYPFAMELFAWHTATWPSSLNKKMKDGGACGPILKSEVLEPLFEAIQKSKFKFAYCVGRPIGEIIDSFGIITKMNSIPINLIPGIERYYDVYSDNKGCFIVNTWAQGGNTYPSANFDKEEEKLFKNYHIVP